MKNVYLIPILIIIISLLCIEIIIPVQFLVQHELGIALLSSFIIVGCLVQIVTKFQSLKEFLLMKDFLNDWRYKVVIISLFVFFIFTFLIILRIDKLDDNYVVKYGQMTYGRIVDGTVKLKIGGEYHLKVQFISNDNKTITIEKDIASNEDNFYIGQEVELYYLKNNPQKFLIITNNRIKELFNIEDREVNIKDLLKTINTPSDSIEGILNIISYKWSRINDSIWINKRKNLYLSIANNKHLTYKFFDIKLSALSFPYQLEEEGFRAFESSKNQTVFKRDSVVVQFEKDNDLITTVRIIK